jgi:hypothetical protein
VHKIAQLACVSLMALPFIGCRDNSPPTAVVPPPQLGRDTYHRGVDYPKPLPPRQPVAPGPQPFHDQPLLVDQPPEARAFADVYQKVGRPRIVVFVNRTLEGQLLPTGDEPEQPERITETVRSATTGVKVESDRFERRGDRRGETVRDDRDRFETAGAGEYRETTTTYLRPGEYDVVGARAIDYGMMEMLLADWMGADGKVAIISPTLVRKRLTDQQIRDLQEGRPRVLAEIAEGLDADILIQVQARPTRQTPRGLDVRIIAEAMNLRGGESLARAAVDMEPPLDKIQLNTYTRFMARKLMDGMIQTWTSPPPPEPAQPAPAPQGGAGPRKLPPAPQPE